MVLLPTRYSALLFAFAALCDRVSFGWTPQKVNAKRANNFCVRAADRTEDRGSNAKKTSLQQVRVKSQHAVLRKIQKNFQTAQDKSRKDGGNNEKRFCIQPPPRDVTALMELFGSNATLDSYMALPLASYNVKFFAKGSFDEDEGTFHLELPLSDVPNVGSALDGLSLVLELQVDPNLVKRRNTFRFTKFSLFVDEARAASDAAKQEQDEIEIKLLKERLASTNQSKAMPVNSRPGQLATLVPPPGTAAGSPETVGAFNDPDWLALLTRTLLKAQIELKGEAQIEWAGPNEKLPGGGIPLMGRKELVEMPWQKASDRDDQGVAEGGGAEAKRGASPMLRLRTKGTLEFTAHGLLSYFPKLLVQQFVSIIANQVLKFTMPKLLAFLSVDYSNWAQGKPRAGEDPTPTTRSTNETQ
uniref:SMP-LTD domain-containing protein n=1 Tax=Octactis speculum TaxID=3111310 RepID=A0A7S2MBC5_9STRA|mmetsp:Transcript_58928/g.80449  ORF Transcript_58928/g.80449 Transcript_58928/m.80449 type:complete len:414 (+) Transcript_58928:87-1328(+)